MRLQLGAPVHGHEGELGVLADLVVDPRSRRVTHLVVAPRHHPVLARLVPIELALHAESADSPLTLRCSADALRRLPEVGELAYGRLYDFPVEDPDWDVGIADVLASPDDGMPGLGPEPGASRPVVFYDRIPKGEAELRRGSPVVSADGRRIGRVAGVVTDDGDRFTALVVRRSRLRRPRELAIPAAAVARVETDAVRLRVAKREFAHRPR